MNKEYVIKTHLLEVIKNSNILKEKLTTEQIIIMGAWVTGLSLKEAENFLSEQMKEYDQNKGTKYAAAGVAGTVAGQHLAKKGLTSIKNPALAGAAAGMGLLLLYRKFSDPCVRSHIGNASAQAECKLAAIRRIQQNLKASMNSCGASPNPADCRSKFYGEYDKWESRAQDLVGRISPGQ